MAIAMKKFRTEKVVVDKQDGVCLDLTHEEARVLKIILSRVGGHPGDTLRGYQNNISDALEEAGYKYKSSDMVAIKGSLTFTYETLGIATTDEPTSFRW